MDGGLHFFGESDHLLDKEDLSREGLDFRVLFLDCGAQLLLEFEGGAGLEVLEPGLDGFCHLDWLG